MAKKKTSKKQLEALAKGREVLQHSHSHGGGRRSWLSGIGNITMPKWNDIQIVSTFEKVGLFLVGYVGGREIDRRFIKSGDQDGFKKFIGPVLTAGGGIVLANMKGEMMRYIGYGLVAAGAVSGVNNALGKGKDITNLETLKGFSLGDLLGGKTEIPVYKDPLILKLPPYKPSLPDLDTEEAISSPLSLAAANSEPELLGDEDATLL